MGYEPGDGGLEELDILLDGDFLLFQELGLEQQLLVLLLGAPDLPLNPTPVTSMIFSRSISNIINTLNT